MHQPPPVAVQFAALLLMEMVSAKYEDDVDHDHEVMFPPRGSSGSGLATSNAIVFLRPRPNSCHSPPRRNIIFRLSQQHSRIPDRRRRPHSIYQPFATADLTLDDRSKEEQRRKVLDRRYLRLGALWPQAKGYLGNKSTRKGCWWWWLWWPRQRSRSSGVIASFTAIHPPIRPNWDRQNGSFQKLVFSSCLWSFPLIARTLVRVGKIWWNS